MPRACSICSHRAKETIDRALVAGEPNRRIAARHDVSEQAVRRHKDGHLPAALAVSHKAEEVSRADDLLGQVRDLQARTLSVLADAEAAGEIGLVLAAVREGRRNLELLAKLVGELGDGSPVVNVVIGPQVRAVILDALQRYPEARYAVADALAEIEG